MKYFLTFEEVAWFQKRLDSKLHYLVIISKALVISLYNTVGFFPFSSLFPKRDSLGNCGVSTMCLETNKTTVAVGFFIFCTFMHPFSSVHCKYIWGWKVQGWKVYGWRLHGWKVWCWKVRGWSLGLKSPGLKCPFFTWGWKVQGWNVPFSIGDEKSGVEMSGVEMSGVEMSLFH